jgi:hypothetical protein
LARLVNRADARGAYRPVADRGKVYVKADGSESRLGALYTAKFGLSKAVLRRHFEAIGPEHLAGAHSTSPQNTSRWAALDIDMHGETSSPPEANWAAALAWYQRLCLLDCDPLLIDSNGRGGYHLLQLFTEPVATARVHAFLLWLTADFASYGLSARPEVFPKQRRIKDNGFGNWLRLPGRHHSREHWSKVWDGSTWLAGDAAVDYLLGCRGDPPGIIPLEAVRQIRPLAPARPAVRPSLIISNRGNDLDRRIAAYLAKLPGGMGEGTNRHGIAYGFAAFLIRDLAQPDDVALSWLRQWDSTNAAALGETELVKQIACAHSYGTHALGSGLASASRTIRRSTISRRFTVRF